jgi:hypothetical protein
MAADRAIGELDAESSSWRELTPHSHRLGKDHRGGWLSSGKNISSRDSRNRHEMPELWQGDANGVLDGPIAFRHPLNEMERRTKAQRP